MAYAPQVGQKVRYRASGRVRPATVVLVRAGNAVDLRVGSASNGTTITNVTYRSTKGSTTGWVRGAR